MTKQEENWELMTVLQIPWHHANQVKTKEDRDFLLSKAKEVKSHIEEQQRQMMEQQQQQQQIIQPVPEHIITP